MAYEFDFASVYDIFTDGVNYESRTDYICQILNKNGITDGIILDVACGTGSVSKCLLEKGFDVIANDISVSMLNIAREKLEAYGDKIMLLCQDMCELDLFGTVDAAVCCLDSLNHLSDEDDFDSAVNSIATFIRPEGLFVFDVNTVYKHREILSDNTFVYEDDNAFLVWQNSECDSDDTIEMLIDIFSLNSDGSYTRKSDYVVEKAYSVEFITNCLKNNGFEVLNIYGDVNFMSPSENEERIYFVAKKK